MTPLRFSVGSEGHNTFAREVWFVVDNQTGIKVSGNRQSEESAQAEADRKNGELLRLEHEGRVAS